MRRFDVLFLLAFSGVCAAWARAPSTMILLVDEAARPEVEVSWTTRGGTSTHAAALDYGPPTGGERIGANIEVYASVGGTRVETGSGHPRGLVLRVGLTKVDAARPFFDRLAPRGVITIAMRGVRLREPIRVHGGTGLVHLKYAIGDLEACSLPGTARNQYLLSDPDDTLGGRVVAGENATPGALDGSEGRGSFVARVDPDDATRIDLEVSFPYRMLRHLGDPWESGLPNTFFEPIHLHAEVEVIPIGAEPLDREIIDERQEERRRDGARGAEDAEG